MAHFEQIGSGAGSGRCEPELPIDGGSKQSQFSELKVDGPPPSLMPAGVERAATSVHWRLAKQWIGRLPWQVRVAGGLIAGVASAACVGLGGLLVYYTMLFPDPLALRAQERAPVIRILARDGQVLAERGAAHDFMPLTLLPDHVIRALVATEDRRFFEHWGLDPFGLVRAMFANVREGRFAQGGSTLTQQLAKNLFLSPDRTMARKVEELMLAIWLEMRLSKHDILELYLNRVYFGGGAYGIEAAAQRYFEKSARELTLAEGALIAGLLKAPSKYSPAVSPGAARTRGRSVLAKMQAAGFITGEQASRASDERIRFASPASSKDQGGVEYLVDFALERMPPLLGGGHAEVVVETTLDAPLQRSVQAIVQQQLARSGESLNASQAAVVVLDTDGGIRALVGGRSYAQSQFNRAVKAKRQPGSAFKPFVYLAAVEGGLTPDSVVYDLPITVGGWSPRNDNGLFRGAMPLRQALTQSVNTVAVRLLLDAGASRVAHTAQRLGIRSELSEKPSLALGTSEVTLLELTGAYGVLANGGSAIEPHAIRRVRLSSGRILHAREAPRTHQAVSHGHVAAMNDMLNAALVSGTGRRAAIPMHPAAGKTGTTTDFRDAWFVGYTAHLVAGVWVGNDNGRAMNRVMGGNLPADIWREVMRVAHQGRAPLALPGTQRQPQPTLAPREGEPTVVSHTPPPPVLLAPLPQPTAPPPANLPKLPKERIGEDFIARMLAPEPAQRDTLVAEDRMTPTPPERPAGIMSLGRQM